MKTWHSASELAALALPELPSSVQGINLRAKRQGWEARERAGRGSPSEFASTSLPPRAQAALLLRDKSTAPAGTAGALPEPPATQLKGAPQRLGRGGSAGQDFDTAWRRFELAPEGVRRRADERFVVCRSVAALMDAGTPRRQAIEAVAAETGTPFGTLRDWMDLVNGIERQFWQAKLAPSWCGRQKTADCSPEAWDFFKADYLRLEQPRAAAVYDRLKRAAAEHGWTVPSLKTLLRRIEREIPKPALVLARKGEDQLLKTYPAQSRDKSALKPMEAVNADGRRHDVMVKFPAAAGEPEEIGRPVIVALQDVYSGKLLSWRVGRSESAELVRLAIADMVKAHGIPDRVVFDNGRAFASKWITGGQATRNRFKVKQDDPAGVLTQLGCEVHWATPYHGQAKPIERAFNDLAEYVDKHPALAGAYTGKNTSEKPENYGSRAVPLATFTEILATEIAAHNARPGRTSPVAQGRSFDQVFEEGVKGALIRRANPGQVAQLLLAAAKVSTHRADGSVALYGNRYWTDSAALARHAGKPAIARFDPQDLTTGIHLYQLDGRFIASLPIFERTGFFDQESAARHLKARGDHRKATRRLLDAERRLEATDVAALMPKRESQKAGKPESQKAAPEKVVRPVFGIGTAPASVTATATPARMSREERERRMAEHLARVAPHLMPKTA